MSVTGRLRARAGMLVIAGVCLLEATPASAGDGIGSGRLVPTVAAVVGLISVVLGALALVRPATRISTRRGRRGAIAAGVAGLISVVVGGLHSANAAGGFGTGNGLAGAIVAMVVGLIGLLLGGWRWPAHAARRPADQASQRHLAVEAKIGSPSSASRSC